MFKSNLQELCQKRSWSLPKYSASKHGVDHSPSFSATVFVNQLSFQTPSLFKSSKEAQNDAARLAFHHFTLSDAPPSPSSFPQPSLFLSQGFPTVPACEETRQEEQRVSQPGQSSSSVDLHVDGVSSIGQETGKFKDVQHLYKNELQIYAQKRNLLFPVYFYEREGPPHASRFKCKLTFEGKTYESTEFFSTLKEAEHSAAKVALTSLSPEGVENEDSAFYKNLLQELVQKTGFRLPRYDTQRSGEAYPPVFVSVVEIKGEKFVGEKASTKKQAEISAAKAAYHSLRECKSSQITHISTPAEEEQKVNEHLPSSMAENNSANAKRVRRIVTTVSRPSSTSMQQVENPKESADAPSDIKPAEITSTDDVQLGRELAELTLTDAAPTNTVNGSTRDTLSSKTDSHSPSTLLNDVKPSLPYKKIVVYPATKKIPDGATLLPISDEKWVAFYSH